MLGTPKPISKKMREMVKKCPPSEGCKQCYVELINEVHDEGCSQKETHAEFLECASNSKADWCKCSGIEWEFIVPAIDARADSAGLGEAPDAIKPLMEEPPNYGIC